MRKKLRPIFSLFSGVQIAVTLLLILAISVGYMFLITKHLAISMVVGIITLFFAFYYTVYIPKKMKREQYLLKELQKYATNMVFYLQSGYNVLKALQGTKESVDPTIGKDIEKTIKILKDEARLDTEHFKKYRFSSIDIFHQILNIKYEVGGKSKDLFTKVNKSINFEIVKRDELYRRKNYLKKKIFVMVLMVLSFPLMLSLMAKELYDVYLNLGIIAILVNAVLFIAVLVSTFFLQKATADLDLQ